MPDSQLPKELTSQEINDSLIYAGANNDVKIDLSKIITSIDLEKEYESQSLEVELKHPCKI